MAYHVARHGLNIPAARTERNQITDPLHCRGYRPACAISKRYPLISSPDNCHPTARRSRGYDHPNDTTLHCSTRYTCNRLVVWNLSSLVLGVPKVVLRVATISRITDEQHFRVLDHAS